MDHVLIDTRTNRMLGRGLMDECVNARAVLSGNEHIVYCGEAKGFAVYEHAQLVDMLLAARNWQSVPGVSYGTLCKALRDESQKIGPVSVYLSTLGEHEMSQAPEQNGVKWPQRGASARIFEIAQQISTQKQDYATKDEVVAAATAESINAGTAATQYSAWRRYWEGPAAGAAAEPPAPPAAPVAPVAHVAPAAPVAPAQPSTQLAPAHVQAIQHSMQQAAQQQPAPAAFAPPAAPQFAAPAAPQAPANGTPPSAPFAQPPAAREMAVAGKAPEPEQRVAVNVGFHVGVDLQPAIVKIERLLQLLKDAQSDFGG